MGTYMKTMAVVVLFIVVIAVTGFKSSITTSVEVLQNSLDHHAKDSASLIALSLNGVDLEAEVDLVESLIKGAYALGTFEEVTLYGKPSGENQNLKMQNKKDLGKDALKSSFFELKSSEALADILVDGDIQGKILVKSDITIAFKAMEQTVQSLMKLFALLGLGAIIIIGLVVKFVVRTPNS